MMYSHLQLAHHYWGIFLKPGDCVIDATCGNGHDSLKLAQLVLTEKAGALLCIDVQDSALEATKERLKNSLPPPLFKKIIYHKGCHAVFPPLPNSPRLIVYNLGYLPGGNKSLTTEPVSTLTSLKCALNHLQRGGMLSITCYSGHETGEKEEKSVLSFAQSLSENQYQVVHHQWVNRTKAPSLLMIQKKFANCS